MAALFLVLSVARGAALPVFAAFALAYALDPLIDRLERLGLSRTVGIGGLFAASLAGSVGALLYLVPALGAEFAKLPEFFRNITRVALPRLEAMVGVPLPTNVHDAAAAISQAGGGLTEKVLPKAAELAWQAAGGTASVVGTAVGLLVIPVLAFYLLRDYDELVAWARGLLPRRYEALVSRRFADVDAVLGAFIRGQLLVGAILSAIYSAGLSIARLDLAVVIGVVAGFGNMIPYVGTALGIGLALLSLAIGWLGTWQLAVVAATFVVAQLLEGLLITPRIVGEKVGLSPLAVMVALLGFSELFGFTGILLAVPAAAALKVAAGVVLFRYRRSQLYRGTP
ncbi:MAG: AI-2E family transporter [Myxococcales bacterium]